MTQTATAAIDSPGLEEDRDTRIAVRQDWTPEAFEKTIQMEKQMRSILQRYMKDAMVESHHYYSFKEGDKPALTQEGAHSICSLMKAIIGPPENRETYHEGSDHYSVSSRVEIFNQNGERIATGDGSCSTRESKYAYRWYWTNELPSGIDKSTLKTRGKKDNPQYQLPNQDLPDLYNTVLKMAVKRAKVAAVRQLPLVSELFLEDDGNNNDETSPAKAQTAKASAGKSQPSAPAQQPDLVATSVATADELARKLVGKGVELEDLVTQFLPEGVAKFTDLTEAQAAEIIPGLSTLLTAKVNGK